MSFIHDDPDSPQLLAIVARETPIAAALVEKVYWVTHCLWALHETGFDLWFKGGTSLSKGFGLIQRFSEDLDLMVQHGTASLRADSLRAPRGRQRQAGHVGPEALSSPDD